MTDFDHWLHDYRKLYRDDPMKFSIQSCNFTDSQLKFRRNMLYILKKRYLTCDEGNVDRLLEMIDIVEHIIKTNQKRNWDVLENEAFI